METASSTQGAQLETLSGEIDAVRHFNEDTGFFIAKVLTGQRNVSVLGTSRTVPAIGTFITARGRWQDSRNPDFPEKQFRIVDFQISMPTKVGAIMRLLDNLKLVGPIRAQKIIDKFGDKALERIIADPKCIIGIGRIGEESAEKIAASLRSQANDADAELILAELGLGPKARTQILKEHKAKAFMEAIKEDPYWLVTLPRVAFNRVDKWVLVTGRVLSDSVRRGAAVAIEALKQHCMWGHTFAEVSQVYAAARRLGLSTPISQGAVAKGIEYAITKKRIAKVDATHIALCSLDSAECGSAEILANWLDNDSELGSARKVDPKNWAMLNEEQKAAIENAVNHRVSILTGGPGTGKTFVSKAVLQAMDPAKVQIVAPTGKAACRANQLTGFDASTIHRFCGAVEYQVKKAQDDESGDFAIENVIPQVTLLDEASMVDIEVFAWLLRTLNHRRDARIVIVGDVDQLPSIGSGAVLSDLIESNAIPVTHLRQVMRQSGDSAIIPNAYAINNATPEVHFEIREADDFVMVCDDDPQALRGRLIEYLRDTLPAEGKSLLSDVQVLTGQRKTALGTEELNDAIRAFANPPKSGGFSVEVMDRAGKSRFRVGDKVMCIQNNYELGVVNGDQGVVEAISQMIDDKGKTRPFMYCVTVNINGEPIVFEADDVDTLTQAWAVTVHKSQGSEYPVAIVLCHNVMEWALQKALLYTAVTRGKGKVVIFGTEEDVRRAALAESQVRYTRLCTLLAQ